MLRNYISVLIVVAAVILIAGCSEKAVSEPSNSQVAEKAQVKEKTLVQETVVTQEMTIEIQYCNT